MRVALVSGSWPPIRCGVGDYVARLVPELAARGVAIDVVTSRAGRGPAPRGVRVHPVVNGWGAAGAGAVCDCVLALAPDLVHVQYPTVVYGRELGINLLPALLRRRAPRLPVVTTLHEFAQYGRAGRLRLALNVLLARTVCVTSEEERAAVAGLYLSARGRLRVIPVGSAIPVAGSAAAGRRRLRALGVRGRDRALLYFGWPAPGKGLMPLYEAVRRLWDAAVPVRLVGASWFSPRGHPFHAALARRARELEIMDLVRWTGYLPERAISDLLLAADLCVFPFEDGLKLNRSSFIAALVHGTPVVTTHGPGVRAVAGAALTLTRPDGEPLARAIREALRHPPRSRAPWPRAARPFAWGRIAGAYTGVYRSALAS